MKLEQQLTTLAELGLKLNDGVTIDDLLYSFDREDYEEEPFDLILSVLGSEVESEPSGRDFCSRVWDFDVECIVETGDYVRIVERLCKVAGRPGLITEIEDYVNLETGEAWLKYTIDGLRREHTVAVNDDWADGETIDRVMSDIERDSYRFYGKDNGQATVWFYLDEDTAAKLNELSGGALVAD